MKHKMRTLQGQLKALLKQLDFQKRRNEVISAEFAYKARRMRAGYELDYDHPDRMTLVLRFDITQLQAMREETREAFARTLLEDVANSAGWTGKECSGKLQGQIRLCPLEKSTPITNEEWIERGKKKDQ